MSSDKGGLILEKRWIALAVSVYLLIYIAPLGVRPLIIPDETRYAEIPREMIQSGDWAVPRLNGIRYFEKPVMGYWLTALSMSVFGENEFAVRLPGALSAGLTSLVIFLLVSRLQKDRSTALLAAIMHLTFAGVFGVGTFNVLDSQLTFLLTAACASFLAAYVAQGALRRVFWLSATGIFCASAFLTKGFLAFAVPVLAAGPFLILERRPRLILTMPLIPLGWALITALPWAALIAVREPDFWPYFFWTEHIKRFFSSAPQHPQPFWYFAAVMPLMTLPWSLLFPAAASWYRAGRSKDVLIRFALCWFIFPFVFFSVSRGKLATYILPCLPPLAVLAAVGLKGYLEGGKGLLFRVPVAIQSLLTAAMAIGSFVFAFNPFGATAFFQPDEAWKPLAISVSMAAWSALAFLSTRQRQIRKSLLILAAAPVVAYFSAHFILPRAMEDRKSPGVFLERIRADVPDDALVVTDESLAPSVCWYHKRRDLYLLEDGGELKYGLSYPDSADRLLTLDRFSSLSRSSPRPVILIADARFFNRTALPQPERVITQGRFTMARYR